MIKETLDISLFRARFENYNRVGENKDFTYAGLEALFQYLEDLSEDMNHDMELDVIGLCCEYIESSIEDALKDYNLDDIDELRNSTTVVDVDHETIIYQAF